MNIIKPSCEYLRHKDGTMLEFIEFVGRTCYKSTDKITKGSAEGFVERLIKSKHYAMLEHETIYLDTRKEVAEVLVRDALLNNISLRFFNFTTLNSHVVISGNLRAFFDLMGLNIKDTILEKICKEVKDAYPNIFKDFNFEKPMGQLFNILSREEFIEKYKDRPFVLFRHLTHTGLFIMDRGISHNIVRHRLCSFAQESTRYCNYSKEKFGNGISVIEPFYYKEVSDVSREEEYNTWKSAMSNAENAYLYLMKLGSQAQEARAVLPNSLKTEIVITATEEEWQHIIDLRVKGVTGSAHPQIVEVLEPWYKILEEVTEGRIS